MHIAMGNAYKLIPLGLNLLIGVIVLHIKGLSDIIRFYFICSVKKNYLHETILRFILH